MFKTLGIIAPSYFVSNDKLIGIEKFLNENGFNVIFAKNVYKKEHVYAGSIRDRVDGIEEIYSNKNVDFVLALRGGDGCLSVVDLIDYNIIKNNPKPLFGYSDITALHFAVVKNTNQATYYSMNASNLIDDESKTNTISKNYFMNQLNNYDNLKLKNEAFKNIAIIKKGQSEGILVGGNIQVIQQCIGTENDLNFDGKILFLEDAKRNMIDFINTLVHLKRAGKFDKIKGLIIGEIFNIKSDNEDLKCSIDDIMGNIFCEYNIPTIYNAPFGHGTNKIGIPINKKVILDTESSFLYYECK